MIASDTSAYLAKSGFCTLHTADVMCQAIENRSRSDIAIGISIDGGGVKGLTSIAFLNYIFGSENISDHVDLIAGTSTGGIIAAALTASEGNKNLLSNKDVLDMYKKPKNLFRKNLCSMGGLFSSKYKSNQSVFKEILGNAKIEDTTVNLLITAYNYTWDKMKYFKSGRAGYHLYDVLTATSAAPTYFPPIMLENHQRNNQIEELRDGGVGMNDPSFSALTEMNLLKKTGKIKGDTKYNLLIRIGTANCEKLPRGRGPSSIIGTIPYLTKMFMGVAESIVSENVISLMADNRTLVFNIDIALTSGSIEMDNVEEKNIQSLLKDTEKFIQTNMQAMDFLKSFISLS